VFRAQADWTLILPPAASCESAAPLAEKNAAVRQHVLRSSLEACTMNTVYIPTRKNHKALDPDFLVASLSVPCVFGTNWIIVLISVV
jgi:hypothetical protein